QRGGTNSGDLINLNAASGGTGSYDMTGGLLEATQIKKGNATGTATISFDGSILRAVSTTTLGATFFTGLNTAEIKSGGLTLDDNGINLTISQLFTGAGGLTKS